MADDSLITERLCLRGEREGDKAIWLKHMNTPAVMANLGGVRSEADIDRSFAAMADRSDLPYFFVALRSDDTLIGKAGLSRIAETGAPERIKGQAQVGWSLREDYWGQGYAREAALALLNHGFGRLGLSEIWAQTSDSNIRSTRLIERLGMKRRSEFDYTDPDYPPEDNPATIWSLTKADWIKQKANGDG